MLLFSTKLYWQNTSNICHMLFYVPQPLFQLSHPFLRTTSGHHADPESHLHLNLQSAA